MSGKNSPYTYAQAGVSIEAGNALVKAIGPLVKATARPGADSEIGGFGGFFDPRPRATPTRYWSRRMTESVQSSSSQSIMTAMTPSESISSQCASTT